MSNKQWVALSVLLPVILGLIFMYSDVQTLKVTKASTKEVADIRLCFTKQMAKNTQAIENLSEVMHEIKTLLKERRK